MMQQANAALPRFIKEFNQRFHRKAACQDDTAFAPLPTDFDLDTLPAAKYHCKTDNLGRFSFQNYTFHVDIPNPPVRKNIVFLFSEKIGFKAYYDKTCYEVKFPAFLNKEVKKIGFKAYYDKKRYEVKCPDFLNKDKKSHPPEAAKRLVHDSLFCRRHRSRTCRQAGDVSPVNWRP